MSRISMTDTDIEQFLAEERVARLAMTLASGAPVVVPLWYVWLDRQFWIFNLNRAKRTQRFLRGCKTSILVDGGVEYNELRGLHAQTDYRFVPAEQVPLDVRSGFSQRYHGTSEPLAFAGDHTWMAFTPAAIRSWDFRKLQS